MSISPTPPGPTARPPLILPPTFRSPVVVTRPRVVRFPAPGVPIEIPTESETAAPVAPQRDITAPLPLPLLRTPAPRGAVPPEAEGAEPRARDRILAVMALARGETTLEQVARSFGVHVARVQLWVDRARDLNLR